MTLRIAGGAGFLGDSLDAPKELVERTELDYLTLEYLAELTLSILARLREKDPQAGYARDFLEVLGSLAPALYLQPQLKIVTNAGGMNPRACAAAAGKLLTDNGSENLPLGVVLGDDLLGRLEELTASGLGFEHFDTGQPLAELQRPVVSANAYLGAGPIAEALGAGAKLVITGRVADASLTVGPALHEFGWAWDDWNRLAGASVAGHLIECGAQATGGYSTSWQDIPELAAIGYPIAELEKTGAAVLTKTPGSGGKVTRQTIVEQLVYEIGDPAHYLTPDVDVDFTTVEVADQGNDRVAARGATGRPPPETYKVSLAYHDGYTASGQLLVYGRDCLQKAQACAEIALARVKQAGFDLQESYVEFLGAGVGVPGLKPAGDPPREVVLRLAVRDRRREAVERFSKELAPLITSGPAGLAGYASGRPAVRPVFAYWPTRMPKDWIELDVEVRPAKDWARGSC